MTAKASCVFLALLLLVGTQIASSKSVVGKYEDKVNVVRAFSKRATEGESTTLSPSSTPNDKARRETEPTTTLPVDEEGSTVPPDTDQTDDKEPATVKPLDETDKPKKEETTEKPTESDDKVEQEVGKEDEKEKGGEPELVSRLNPEELNKPNPEAVVPLNPEGTVPPNPEGSVTPNPEAAVPPNPEGAVLSNPDCTAPPNPHFLDTNLVPPISYSYDIPQPYHGFVPPPLDPGFAPYPWNFAPTPSVEPVYYEYPEPYGPAFSEGASAGVGSFAGATATASGTGGTVVTSTSPGGKGKPQISSSSSSSGPGASGAAPTVGSRGSFAADDQSVGIEVDGPDAAPATGKPQFNQGPGYASLNGPGYSAFAGGSFGNQFGPNPYANSFPMYYTPLDFSAYFAALQAQQMNFQRQLQAQIQAQQQAGGTSALGGAYISNDRGMVDPNAQVSVNTFSTPNSASSATSVNSRTGLGGSKSSVSAIPSLNADNTNRIWAQSNQIDSNFGFPTRASSGGPQTAYASANLGPQGGNKNAFVSPASPGIFSRFADTIPPPSGNSFGVFSSSSSSTQIGPDGKPISRKVATIGVNDNGKVSYQTVHDP